MSLYNYLRERYPSKMIPADKYHLTKHELLESQEIQHFQQFKVKGFVEVKHLYDLLIK